MENEPNVRDGAFLKSMEKRGRRRFDEDLAKAGADHGVNTSEGPES